MTDEITDAGLTELDRLHAAIPKGRWWVEQARDDRGMGYLPHLLKYPWDDVPTWLAESSNHPKAADVFAFVVAVRNAYPALRDRLRRAEAVCETALQLQPATDDEDRFSAACQRVNAALSAWREGRDAPPASPWTPVGPGTTPPHHKSVLVVDDYRGSGGGARVEIGYLDVGGFTMPHGMGGLFRATHWMPLPEPPPAPAPEESR